MTRLVSLFVPLLLGGVVVGVEDEFGDGVCVVDIEWLMVDAEHVIK